MSNHSLDRQAPNFSDMALKSAAIRTEKGKVIRRMIQMVRAAGLPADTTDLQCLLIIENCMKQLIEAQLLVMEEGSHGVDSRYVDQAETMKHLENLEQMGFFEKLEKLRAEARTQRIPLADA